MEHIFKLTPDLKLIADEEVDFDQNSVGTEYFSAQLDGWSLGENEALLVTFEKEEQDKTVTLSPILMSKECGRNLYFALMPDEVMNLRGEWSACIYKLFNYDEDTGTREMQKVGEKFFFTVAPTICDASGKVLTKYDVATMYEAIRGAMPEVEAANEAVERAREEAERSEQAHRAAERAQAAAEQQASRAEKAAGSLTDYMSHTVRFVKELPSTDRAKEQILYALVTDEDSNLFDLYTLEDGELVHLGSENLLANGVKVYERILLGGSGWTDNRQSVSVPDLEAGQNITAYAAEGSEGAYMAAWLTCENKDGVAVFTCKSAPAENIAVVVEVQIEHELPSCSDYYTGKQTEEKISEAISTITDGAPEAYDTLKEIAEWIEQDETGTAARISRVSKNEKDISALQEAGVAVPVATVTISPNGWGDKRAELTASDSAPLANVTTTSELLVLAEAGSAETVMSCNVRAIAQGVGTVTFTCDTKPSADVKMKIIIFN